MKRKMTKIIAGAAVAAGVFLFSAPGADAGGVKYSSGDKYVKLGGRIQIQYHLSDTDQGATSDNVAFRRLRPYIEGTVHENWFGKFQWDMGEAVDGGEIAIKDAYLRYTGFKDMTITAGNGYTIPFSREALTSSKYQQLVERTFVGDHNYGTPDRQLGLIVEGHLADKKLTYGFGVASASIDPDSKKLDFDTPVNKNADFNEGVMYGARVDIHPFGFLKLSQGDFARDDLKATLSVAGFGWNNDGDNNTRTGAGKVATDVTKADVENVAGGEVSGAVRYMGASVDVEYNFITADTVDPTVTSGIYRNGTTELKNFAAEGGYMVLPSRLELVAGYQIQDADGYAKNWTRTSVGANWFFKKHDIKVQATYRMGENKDGTDGNDIDELFVQAQYVF